MKIHHLNAATMKPLGGGLLDGEPGLLRRAELVCHVLAIESPTGRLVLVDSGLGTRAIDERDRWLGRGWCRAWNPQIAHESTVLAQIQALGFAATDVSDIVVTHLDLDHTGGLVDFPHAQIHVHDRELSAMLTPQSMGENHRYRRAHFEHDPQWRVYAAEHGEPWFGFDGVTSIAGFDGDIVLVPLPGHSRGHTGVAVKLENSDQAGAPSWVLHAGDAYYSPGQIDVVKPRRPRGIAAFEAFGAEDAAGRRTSQQLLRRLLGEAGSQVTVFSSHSNRELRSMMGNVLSQPQDEAARRCDGGHRPN